MLGGSVTLGCDVRRNCDVGVAGTFVKFLFLRRY